MTSNDLPPDLAAIEQALRGGCQPGQSLRNRTMTRVQEELSKRQNFWEFASLLAAAVLLMLNFSFSITSPSRQVTSMDPDKLASLREQLGQIQPTLSPDEIRRQCLLLAAGNELVRLATPYGSATEVSVVLNQ